MRVSYSEGVALHTGSESCTFVPECGGEALTGVRTGQVWSREIEPPSRQRWPLPGADAVELSGRRNRKRRYCETLVDLARPKTLRMYASTLSGDREISCLSGSEQLTDRIGKSKDAPRRCTGTGSRS